MTEDPGAIYRADDDGPLQQGDILLAPVVRLALPGAPPDSDGGQLLDQASAIVSGPQPELGHIEVRVGWGPVVVTSHDCHLEKEFQLRYRQLRKAGRSKNQAIAEAEDDASLDRWLIVAPILDLFSHIDEHDGAGEQAAAAAQRGEVIGLCPIPPMLKRGLTGGVADLTWLATIERETIVARLASMTEEGRALLRMAQARISALRSPEIGFLLEDIIGDRIVDARRGTENAAVIELDLRRSGTIRLLAQPGEPATGGPERTRSSAPTSQN